MLLVIASKQWYQQIIHECWKWDLSGTPFDDAVPTEKVATWSHSCLFPSFQTEWTLLTCTCRHVVSITASHIIRDTQFRGPTWDSPQNARGSVQALFQESWTWQTDRQTHIPCYSICSNRSHLAIAAVWTVSSELLGFWFYFSPYFFVSRPCARLSWPSCQLLSAR